MGTGCRTGAGSVRSTRRGARVLSAALVVTGLAVAAPKLLENVPLQWRATSELRLGAVQMAATPIQFEMFQDKRPQPDRIGENLEDDKPKPVTTADDVGAFVGTHMRELFRQAGLNTVDSNGGVIIRGEVTQFFVRETSTYHAEVAVHLSVVGADGAKRWSGTATGDAARFGRSYKLENYYEVLSDAVVNATSSMLQSAEFQKALGAP